MRVNVVRVVTVTSRRSEFVCVAGGRRGATAGSVSNVSELEQISIINLWQ